MSLFNSNCAGQNKDSLDVYFKHALTDTNQLDLFIQYYHTNRFKVDSNTFIPQLHALENMYNDTSWHRQYFKIKSVEAWFYANLGHVDQSKKLFFDLIENSQSQHDDHEKGLVCMNLAFLHDGNQDSSMHYYRKSAQHFSMSQSNKKLGLIYKYLAQKLRLSAKPDSALSMLSKMDSLCRIENDSMLLADCAIEKGLNFSLQNKYIQSLQELTTALNIYSANSDTEGTAVANINLGNVFLAINDLDMAHERYSAALLDFQALNLTNDIALSYNNLSLVEYNSGEYLIALKYLDTAYNLANDIEYTSLLGDINSNQGLCFMDLKEYPNAIKKLKTGLDIETKIGDKFGIGLCQVNLYNCYFLNGDTVNANKHKTKAIKAVKEGVDLRLEFDLFNYLSRNSLSLGDSSLSLIYHIEMSRIKDSLYDKDRSSLLEALNNNVHYQNTLKTLSTTQRQLDIETTSRKKASDKNDRLESKNRTIIILSTLAGIMLMSLLLVLLFAMRRKKKTNFVLAKQAQKLEEQNKRILSSVDYASSMEKMLIQQMNPHFIFNALTTVEASIAVKDIEFTKQYIHLFSKLLRRTLDHSREASIPLSSEIDYLKDYVALHQLKQHSNIECAFIYDEDEVDDFVNTPPMLVQPFIENALLHGLYHKTSGTKKLEIMVTPKNDHVVWIITDNGIGRSEAARISKTHTGTSHGANITADRISWLKNIYKQDFSIVYTDLDKGTSVTLKIPIVK